jgi:hypothetical protein
MGMEWVEGKGKGIGKARGMEVNRRGMGGGHLFMKRSGQGLRENRGMRDDGRVGKEGGEEGKGEEEWKGREKGNRQGKSNGVLRILCRF